MTICWTVILAIPESLYNFQVYLKGMAIAMAEKRVSKRRTNTKTKKKTTWNRRLSALFEFPDSCASAVPYMELQGDSSLALTGYESLLVYDETNILFRMKPGAGCMGTHDFSLLRIVGQGLTIYVLREGCLCVRGRICSVILHSDAAEHPAP